jgi:hypothetical protein
MTAVPATPALGACGPLGRRSCAVRVAILVGLLTMALMVRASDILHPAVADPSLPPPPAAATVGPGVVRGGQPHDLDLVRLRDDYGTRAVVDVDGPSVEEQAVVRGLGLRMLVLDVPADDMPSTTDILTLVRFLQLNPVGHRSGDSRATTVYLHDSTGRGSALVVSCVLRMLHGVPLSTVLGQLSRAERSALDDRQLRGFQEVEAAVQGDSPPSALYAPLHGVTW